MIRRHITVLRLSLMTADALSAAAVFVAVAMFRFGPGWLGDLDHAGLPAPVAIGTWASVWVTVVWLHGQYRLRARWSARAEASDLIRAMLLVALLVFGILFVVHLPEVSRLLLLLLFTMQLIVAIASRLLIRAVFSLARGRQMNTRYMLVAGTSKAAQEFADLVERHRELGLRVIGHLGRGGDGDWRPTRPVLGTLEDVETILHSRVVDEVAICLALADWPLIEAVTHICAEEGKIVRIPSGEAVPRVAGASTESFDDLTVQSLVYGPDRILALVGKRIIDIVGGAIALVLAAPIMLTIALAVRLTDGAPILFHQRRVGLHGREFEVAKFRTMSVDAERRLEALLDRNEVSGPAFKLTHDPRVSRVGRWLRRSSLDELPQFINVIRGEMSLVGPRPPLGREVAGYDVWHRRRLSMKPGITGLWQVSARRNPDFNRWVSIDLDYIDRWSLWLDFQILARTIPAMLQGR